MELKKHIAEKLKPKLNISKFENYKDLINIFVGNECIPANKKADDYDILEDWDDNDKLKQENFGGDTTIRYVTVQLVNLVQLRFFNEENKIWKSVKSDDNIKQLISSIQDEDYPGIKKQRLFLVNNNDVCSPKDKVWNDDGRKPEDHVPIFHVLTSSNNGKMVEATNDKQMGL